jgi:hypothetical protein
VSLFPALNAAHTRKSGTRSELLRPGSRDKGPRGRQQGTPSIPRHNRLESSWHFCPLQARGRNPWCCFCGRHSLRHCLVVHFRPSTGWALGMRGIESFLQSPGYYHRVVVSFFRLLRAEHLLSVVVLKEIACV